MKIEDWAKKKTERYKTLGNRMFMNMPDAWFEKWTVACENGHVSTCVLKTDKGSVCLACGGTCTALVPPNTSERFLRSIVFGKKISRLTDGVTDTSCG